MRKNFTSLIFSFLIVWSASAQTDSLSTLKHKSLAINELPILLDSALVIPGSIAVTNDRNIDISQRFQFLNNRLVDQTPSLLGTDSIQISYQILGVDLGQAVQDIDSSIVQLKDEETLIGFDILKDDDQEGLVNLGGLNYQGSFTRGVSFGNAQNLVLNSAFNLRFNGIIGDEIEVQAAISDQNIPLQPEGNTEQIQDFDKIFIQLKKQNSTLIAGDYELPRPSGHFINYFKKLQGARFIREAELGKGELYTAGSVAISKGKFARNIVQPIEGNQGPYRLVGNNSERFLIVLSGTEKVFIDGELMIRGLENDYTIDYNRAEVTFSQKRLITKDVRIIIEFEYSDQNYLRSIYTANASYTNKKSELYFNIYSEQDAKNAGSIQELDSLDLLALQAAGDQVDQAFVSGIKNLETFNEFQVAYLQRDTSSSCDGTYSYLIYSTNPDSAKYSATFLDVGIGNGDYILDESSTANGRVYIYVPPDPLSCAKQGRYLPVRRLIAPNQLQIMALGATSQVNKNLRLSNETTMSRVDLNRFASLDNDDNIGWGNRSDLSYRKPFGSKDSSWIFGSVLSYEVVSKTFKPLNPYRGAEFNRDWNLTRQNTGNTTDSVFNQKALEHIPSAEIYFEKKGFGKFGYQADGLIRKDLYKGIQHNLKLNINQKYFQLNANGRLLVTDGAYENTRYQQPTLNIRKTMPKLGGVAVGFEGLREWNERSLTTIDSLELNSFGFNQYRFFIEKETKDSLTFNIGYGQRYDYSPSTNGLTQNSYSDNLDIGGRWLWNSFSRLQWTGQVRKLTIVDSLLTDQDPKNSLLGRIEHNLNFFKGAFSNNIIYELGSGQEPLIEYRYLEVQPGEGVYFWDQETSDFNNDGIPQIDEIQEAAFSNTANIRRVSLVSNQFIQTNNVRYNQNLRLEPKYLIKNPKSKWKIVRNFSWQSTIQISRKTQANSAIKAYDPFLQNIPDTSLVTLSVSNQHTLFYRPRGTKLDWRIGRSNRQSRNLLTTGFDQRNLDKLFTRFRWNISNRWSLGLEAQQQGDSRDVELFDRQDYDVSNQKISGELTFRPSKNFRIILEGEYGEGKNALQLGGETSNINTYNLEMTFNQSAKTSLRLDFTTAQIRFNGLPNTPVELVMLSGLKNGQNYLWELSLNRTLTDSILLTLNYNGRKTGKNAVVHLGSVQIGARF